MFENWSKSRILQLCERSEHCLFVEFLCQKSILKTETFLFLRAKVQVRQFWGFSNTSLGSTLEDGGGWLVLLAASPPPPPSPWTISGPSLSHMRSWRLFAPLMLAMTEPQQQQQPKAGFLTCFWALDFLMFWAKTEHSILKENWVRNVWKHRNGPGILSLTNTLLFDGYKATQKQSGLKYPKMSHFHFARKKIQFGLFNTFSNILLLFLLFYQNVAKWISLVYKHIFIIIMDFNLT